MPDNQTQPPLLRRVGVFRHEPVVALLDAVEAAGGTIELVKDDGAYLAAWVDRQSPPLTVFAVGHESPDLFRTSAPDELTDTGWEAQRYRVAQTFGGDDFGERVTAADLRAASLGGDVAFVTRVRMLPWPDGMQDMFGNRDAIPRLEGLTGPLPAAAIADGS